MPTIKTIEDVLEKTVQEGNCLVWRRCLNTDGYPRATINGNTNVKVHRLLYSLLHPEEDISQKVIRHTCDNPRCLNPEHLVSGSISDNNRDRAKRKRNYLRHFEEDQVREIRKLYATGTVTQHSLANSFNTTQGSIRQIVLRLSYDWIE